jgi:NADPH:quinone reductase-like Zn-dependent oxidoreductase
MKAVVYERYGPPEVLQLREVPRPIPKSNEVLVKVYSTTVTAGDWRMRKADPFLVRLFGGLFKPSRVKILGFELAGVVAEVGKEVQSFKKGDEVFASCGYKFGAYAEYKCMPLSDKIALKPVNMTFDQAAAVPIGGLTAIRLLNQTGLREGHRVLIYGASGSVGTFAVQIAKEYGAHVTAVCSTENLPLLKSIGADKVIDYKKEDYSQPPAEYDVVLDAVGKASASACKKLLKPGGKFVSVSGSPKEGVNDLLALKKLIESGKVVSVIDKTYTLDQIQDAHRYVEQFRKKGNVVVRVVEQP